MPKQFFSSWKSNHGLQLLAIGIAVGTLFCVLWYRQWLPEIHFGAPEVPPRTPTMTQSRKNYFVARIQGPASTETKVKSGSVLIFTSVAESPNDQRLPIATIPFEMDLHGATTVVLALDPGRYAAIAYLDLNQNAQLDVDSDGMPLEPFRTSSESDEQHDWRDLQAAEFDVRPASTQFRLMQFDR